MEYSCTVKWFKKLISIKVTAHCVNTWMGMLKTPTNLYSNFSLLQYLMILLYKVFAMSSYIKSIVFNTIYIYTAELMFIVSY